MSGSRLNGAPRCQGLARAVIILTLRREHFCRKTHRMQSVISISNLSKVYASGFQALKNINLDIRRGEIFALLGPNGAGKTTLISIVCGIVNPSGGRITVGGHDIIRDYRAARSLIGLVPQELTTD